MSKHSAFVLLECHLMLLLLEDNVQLSHFHASHAGISWLHYGMFQAHRIQKFQSSFQLLLSEVQKTRAWFVLLSGGIFYHIWKFQGKGLWLEWKWRMNFTQIESRMILAENSGKICEMLCCATVTLIQKRKKRKINWLWGGKKGGEKGERCSYTWKYLWKQMLVLILPAAWKFCHN